MLCLPMAQFAVAAETDNAIAVDDNAPVQRLSYEQISQKLKNFVGADKSGTHVNLIENSALKLSLINESCRASDRKCLNMLERHFRENQEHSSNGGILGIFSSLNFWGAAQEAHYTEIELPIVIDSKPVVIEYQIGVGYQVAARQADAQMQGKGMLVSTPASITGKTGGTRFWAMIIGLAPDAVFKRPTIGDTESSESEQPPAAPATQAAAAVIDGVAEAKDTTPASDIPAKSKTAEATDDAANPCEAPEELNAAAGLLCTLDMQPAVTQRYFRDTSARMAEALNRLRRDYRSASADKQRTESKDRSRVCPQVIDFRFRDGTGDKTIKPDKVTDEMRNGALAISEILSTVCLNQRPNAKIVYRDGTATKQWTELLKSAMADAKGKLKKGAKSSTHAANITPPPTGKAPSVWGNPNVAVGDGGVSAAKTSIGQDYDRNHHFLTMSSKTARLFDTPALDRGVSVTMDGLIKTAKIPSILSSIVNYQRDDLSQYLSVKLKCAGGTAEIAGAVNPVANAVAYTQLAERVRLAVDAKTAGQSDTIDAADTRCEIAKINARYDKLHQERATPQTDEVKDEPKTSHTPAKAS